MLKTRIKRLAAQHERASERLADIETSIASLGDEDILDLADIFKAMPETALNDIVQAEMTRRDISLQPSGSNGGGSSADGHAAPPPPRISP